MSTIVNANTLRAELTDIALAKKEQNEGKDYMYITPEGFGKGSCLYVHFEYGKLIPGCLFGHWLLTKHDMPVEQLNGMPGTIETLARRGRLKEYVVLTPMATAFAMDVQHMQDSGFRGWIHSIDYNWRENYAKDSDDNANSR